MAMREILKMVMFGGLVLRAVILSPTNSSGGKLLKCHKVGVSMARVYARGVAWGSNWEYILD